MSATGIDFGEAVDLLLARGERQSWTQAKMARRLRISEKHMSLVATHKTGPSVELLEDWAHVLGCSVRISVEVEVPDDH